MPMEKTCPLEGCQSVFCSGELTTDAYTRVWIKFINDIEKRKNLLLEHKLTKLTQIDDITRNGMACPTEGGWDGE